MRQSPFFLLPILFVSCVAPDGEPFPPSDGLYLRGGFQRVSQGGDFDGNTALVGPGEAVVIPNVDDGTGYEAAIGLRGDAVDFEFVYGVSSSDGSVLGTPDFDFDRQTFDINMRLNLLREGRFRPYLLLGVGYMQGDIKNGTLIGSALSDADLSGLSVPVGIGLETFLTPHLSIDVRGSGRLGSYASANGLQIDDNVDGDSLDLVLGVTVTF